MYCTHCGIANIDGAVFCKHCGTQMQNDSNSYRELKADLGHVVNGAFVLVGGLIIGLIVLVILYQYVFLAIWPVPQI
jgi:uncharacterized membrane protein YvbJ